ncbi:MAG: type 1 glutamine amidotransferase [Candidatus Nanopelagicaceae bacterium]|nr:type 1 glutamine amidotransferase [Candidatus Nanopelagicaceae bacterium]
MSSARNLPTILVLQNGKQDPPHLVGAWLEEIGFRLEIITAFNGAKVPSAVPNGICAVIPMGGSMSATDDEVAPWLPAERSLLADAVNRNIPIFAICLGAQLLAAATDGEVTRAQTGEIGLHSITFNEIANSDPVFETVTKLFPVPVTQWHEDHVSKLPSSATVLASSELCPNQVYRIRDNIYAVQFHPEVDGDLVHEWEIHADNAFKSSGRSDVAKEIHEAEGSLIATWKPVLQKWGERVLAKLD